VPIPEELRGRGTVFVVSRLPESGAFQESVTAVAGGTQEFEIPAMTGDVLAVTILDGAGGFWDAAVVEAGTSTWPVRPTPARVLRVPQDYDCIQHAVDAATAGDTVLVGPGTWFETVRLKDGIRLIGSGARETILDGRGEPVNLVDFSGASDVVVAGFTFQNVGAGTTCDPLDVTRCSGNWYRAGVYADIRRPMSVAPTSALVMHNIFRNNPIGVLLYFHPRVVVRNNLFVGNTHGFVANHSQDVGLVASNVFWENTHKAIVSQAAYLHILNNVVARSPVGIFHEYVQTGGIRCNLFFQNGANGAESFEAPPRFEIGKAGNLELDPRFVSSELGDFHLEPASPGSNAGCFEGLEFEPGWLSREIGAYGGPLGLW
jgi:hypothetical protein